MGWLNDALAGLEEGRAVLVRPTGGSMRGRIESGQLVMLSPVDPGEVRAGDAVLIAWKGTHILHLVLEVRDGQLLIGNNLGKENGWAPAADVVGRVTAVGPLPADAQPLQDTTDPLNAPPRA